MIARTKATELLTRLNSYPAVGILGPRQVGKTTLVKSLLPSLPMGSVYLDLEAPSDQQKLNDPELFFHQYEDRCVVLDEIHHAPRLLPILRSMIDQRLTPGRFIILGSASPYLIRESSESLAGRIAYIELMPFHCSEIPSEFSQQHHWFRGGFPNAFLGSDDAETIDWLDFFIRSYTDRDLPSFGFTAAPLVIRRFWSMLAQIHGSILKASLIAKSLGVSETTVKRYLDFMEYAFLVRRLRPFHVNLRKRLIKTPKIFLRDSGVLHRLLGVSSFDALMGHTIVGHSFEGYVIEQIHEVLPRDVEMYYYRTHDGSECDLVLVHGVHPIAAIEIKFSSAPSLTRGNTIAMDDLQAKHNFVLTPHSDDYLLRKDLRVCSLQTFLAEYLPKLV